jgi:hypothetical protein
LKVINDMAMTTSFMGLRAWNQLLDDYDHDQLTDNWAKIDNHDHTPGRGVLLTTESIANASITLPQMASASLGLAAGAFLATTSTSALTANVEGKVAFTSKTYDVSSWFDVVTNVGRYTPLTQGYYRLSSTIFTTSTNVLQAIIYKNGSPYLYGAYGSTAGATGSAHVNGLVHTNGTTDFFEVFALSTATTAASGAKCFFAGELIGLG